MICPKEKRVCPCDLGVIPPCSTADEFVAMAKDAERYRWFRNKLRDYDGDVALWEHTKGCDYDIKQGANLDVAIDAAMAERNK